MRTATDYRPEILKHAARLFARKRFDEVLMEDVADKVGVAKGTLYRFYATKEELYSAICFDWMDDLVRQMREIAAGDGSVEERMEAIIVRATEHFREHQDFFHVLQRQETQKAYHHRPELLERRAAFREVYAKLIREGQSKGLFRGVHAAQAGDMLMGMVRSLLLFGQPSVSAKAIAHGVLDVFLHGVSQNHHKGARK